MSNRTLGKFAAFLSLCAVVMVAGRLADVDAQITQPGVISINNVSGPFSFTGGVSCTGTTCDFTGGSGGVTSFNTRTGAVVPASGDYTAAEVTGAATSGANSNITSLSGLTTPLSLAQGGTGAVSLSAANIAATNAANTFSSAQTFDSTISQVAGGVTSTWTTLSNGIYGFTPASGYIEPIFTYSGYQWHVYGSDVVLGWYSLNNPGTSGTLPDTSLYRASAGTVGISNSTNNTLNHAGELELGTTNSAIYDTATNCQSSASAAVCGSASAGMVAVPAGGTTLVVDTTAITANSEVELTFDSSLGTALSVTCNTSINQPTVSARTAATSFTITMSGSITTNPDCVVYRIVN